MTAAFRIPDDVGTVLHPQTRAVVVYHLSAGSISWVHEVGRSTRLEITPELGAEIAADMRKRGLTAAGGEGAVS